MRCSFYTQVSFKPTNVECLDKVTHELAQFLRVHLLCPKMYKEKKIRLVRGALLSGPPGNSYLKL